MTSGANEPANPFLSTPVAAVATALFAGQDYSTAGKAIAAAEEFVGLLIERGHLPLEIEKEPEPKSEDATLVLRAIMFGRAKWLHLTDKRDPRGAIQIVSPDGFTERTFDSKLVKGIPTLDDRSRSALEEVIAYDLRRL